MTNSFRNRIFFVLFAIGLIYTVILISQSDYLTKKRRHKYLNELDHNRRSRMHVYRSQQALQNYRAWSQRQHPFRDGGENEFPQGDDAPLLGDRAWPKKLQLIEAPKRSGISRNDGALQMFRPWPKQQHSLPDVKKATVGREMYGVFQTIEIGETNDKRWPNRTNFNCTPRKNIAFFKMHKCSSSTIQNILFRFGERHALDFVLPPVKNILGRSYFDKNSIIQFPVEKYNVLCHHTRFSAEGFAEVMPEDAIYATIIRDPVRMYESSFSYNDIAFRFDLPPENGLELFMRRPAHYYYSHNIYSNSHVKNPMLYDLGLQDIEQFNWERIDRKIVELTGQFDLVMITEYFDESLILLRHLMCWEIDDIVYFVLNARSKSSVQTLSDDLTEKIREWNAGDVKLYDVFNRTFWKRVEAFGLGRMREEVDLLRRRVEFYEDLCIAKVVDYDMHVWHPYGIKIDSFKLKPESHRDLNCVRMIRSEIPYTQSLRFLQLRRYSMHESVDVMM